MKKTNNDPSFEAVFNKGLSYFWLFLMLGCLAGVIFAGAWWHLFTGAMCFVMWQAMRSESKGHDE